MRQAFDSAQLTVMGEPVALVDNVATNTIVPPVMTAAASPSGTLVYSTANAGTTSKLVWFDRAGTRLGELGAEGAHADLEISPDGNQVASSVRDPVL